VLTHLLSSIKLKKQRSAIAKWKLRSIVREEVESLQNQKRKIIIAATIYYSKRHSVDAHSKLAMKPLIKKFHSADGYLRSLASNCFGHSLYFMARVGRLEPTPANGFGTHYYYPKFAAYTTIRGIIIIKLSRVNTRTCAQLYIGEN